MQRVIRRQTEINLGDTTGHVRHEAAFEYNPDRREGRVESVVRNRYDNTDVTLTARSILTWSQTVGVSQTLKFEAEGRVSGWTADQYSAASTKMYARLEELLDKSGVYSAADLDSVYPGTDTDQKRLGAATDAFLVRAAGEYDRLLERAAQPVNPVQAIIAALLGKRG